MKALRNIITILIIGLFACNTAQDNKQPEQKNITTEDSLLYPKTTLSPITDSLQQATQTTTIKGDKDTLLVIPTGTTSAIIQNTVVSAQRQPAKTTKKDLIKVSSITITDRLMCPKTTLSTLFDGLRPKTQTFTIKGNKDTLIAGREGTTFTILKNTFINAQGQLAKTINIELVEAISMADIIKSNLQTKSGDKILQTGGMFYIDAKEDNKSLAILDGKSIYVEVQTNYKYPEMKIFDGHFDEKEKIDWKVSGNMENYLIQVPFNQLDFSAVDMPCSLSDEQIQTITQDKYKNTYIATREFEDRAFVLNMLSCEKKENIGQMFLDIYLKNIDKPLYLSDSIIADYTYDNYKLVVDSAMKISHVYSTFLYFANQRLTTTVNFYKLGITERTTPEELMSKGYSKSVAEKYVAFYKQKMRKEIERKSSSLANYSFGINNLGWKNVDMFLDDQKTETSNLLVQIKPKEMLDFISVSLIIPKYKVAIISTHNDNKQYSFTKNEDGYRNLPVGEDAIIVAFSYKNNKPYFGKQEIKIPKDGIIDLALTQSTEQAIKQDIDKLMEIKEL